MATQLATPLEQRLIASINAERAEAGLPPLKTEVHLNAAAQSHSDWMAGTGTIAVTHTGEGGSVPTGRIEDSGFPLERPWHTAENVASITISGELDAGEADKMHELLMDSPGHRANILDPDVDYVGVGLSVGDLSGSGQDAVYLTENFASTSGQVLVQEEVDGDTVLQAYQDGEPVGDPQVPDSPDPDDPGIDDPDDENPQDPEDEDHDEEASVSGDCFVATAAYGSRSHPDVVALRRFRDEVLATHQAGRALIGAYQTIGPRMAKLVSPERVSGRAARALLSPLARLASARIEHGG